VPLKASKKIALVAGATVAIGWDEVLPFQRSFRVS
jgi:hypothetical protein